MDKNKQDGSAISTEVANVQGQISATIAGQLEVFDAQCNAIISQVSDAYVLNLLAARRYEFLLDLTTTIEQKFNEQYQQYMKETIAVVSGVINALNEQSTERAILKEQATAKRLTAPEIPTLQLSSYQDVLEEKRSKQSNLSLSQIKVPENPTPSDIDAISLLGMSLEDIENERQQLEGDKE